MELTEAMASGIMRRTLKSCRKRIFESAGKYGGDFPYLETVMTDVVDAIDKAMDEMQVKKE